MREFLDLSFSFPTVVFTVSTLFLLGFWVVSSLVGAGMNSLDDLDFDFDADTDIDFDVDADLELESDGSNNSAVRNTLEFLGITDMPLLIAVNLLSLVAWLISIVAMTLVGGSDNSVRWYVGVLVLFASFFLAGFVTGRVARKLAHIFIPTQAIRRRELVGTVCIVRTGKVTADFGQAEVRDGEGGSLILQVRCDKENDLTNGDGALIYDLDVESGVFTISPDKSLAP